MTRAVTVPQITRRFIELRTGVFALSATDGAEPNETTRLNFSTSGANGDYFFPQQSKVAGGVAPFAVGVSYNNGWELESPLNANDQVTIDAGTFTLTVRYSRLSTIGHVDRPGRVTWMLFVRGSDGTLKYEVGRAQSAALTFTTTAQTAVISIVTAAPIVLAPGDRLYFDAYLGTTAALGLTSHCAFRTGSIAETRITAIPSYTTQFSRAPAESPAVTDAIIRSGTVARTISDSPALTEALVRVKSMPRALADEAPAVTDGLVRLATYGRALGDTAPSSDSLVRQGTFARLIGDSPTITDALLRLFTGSRALGDSPSVTDSLARLGTFVRSLGDTSPVLDSLARLGIFGRALTDGSPVSDSLFRQGTFNRALGDSAPVADVLSRLKVMSRLLEDVPEVSDELVRSFSGTRDLSDTAEVVDTLGRLIILGRFLDDNLGSATIIEEVIYIFPVFDD